ncbi:hypothetical protein [Streptomyces rimosus]|uniref:hypothetical protein n=1 Tax=Streptomyces rimosus TaxID=1927 RepID=UPI0037D3DCA8
MEPWEEPIRALPVSLPPVHGEVLGWYLHRLAEANCTLPGRLAQMLAPSKNPLVGRRTDAFRCWTPHVTTRLAIISGTPVATLHRHLPAIKRHAARVRGEVVPTRRDYYLTCPHCMRSQGITEPVLAHMPRALRLCSTHAIWLDGNTHYRVGQMPELITAQREHLRLASRFPATLDDATKEADKLIHSWLMVRTQPLLIDRWRQRLDQLPKAEPPPYSTLIRRGHFSDEREVIITYPEFVTLLELIADPRWRAHRILGGRQTTADEHEQTIDVVFTRLEQRLAVPTLRSMPERKLFNNDPLFRWIDPRGRIRFPSTYTGNPAHRSPKRSAQSQGTEAPADQIHSDTSPTNAKLHRMTTSSKTTSIPTVPAEMRTA